jgi:hypothetical protein
MLLEVQFYHRHLPLPLLVIRYIERKLFIHHLFYCTYLTHYIIINTGYVFLK